jgi:hypothetical protein
MLFMVVERFRPGKAPEVYRRFRDRGRMPPARVTTRAGRRESRAISISGPVRHAGVQVLMRTREPTRELHYAAAGGQSSRPPRGWVLPAARVDALI